VVNNQGQTRLARFYDEMPFEKQQETIKSCFTAVSKRPDSLCNFLEGNTIWGSDVRLIYRHYATLYFIFAVDESESELGILDLIQVFVESLDKCFSNVCELDLIFHIDKVNHILDEVVMAGMVLETSWKEILSTVTSISAYQQATKSLIQSKTNISVKGPAKK